MRHTNIHWLLLLLVLAAGAIVGCGDESALQGDDTPNSVPETEVTGTPPVLGQTSFQVEFFWKGFDDDGQIVGYEWRISNNGEDGIISPQDTLASELPWNFTTVTDTVFEVSADLDSFGIDVQDPSQNPSNYRYWQTHTMFVRAVDNEGARDPSPANVSFTATTIAPTVNITLPAPRATITCVQSAKVLTFGWEGTDPDSIEKEPKDIRYLLKPVKTDPDDGCYTRDEYQTANPGVIQHDDPLWSDWIPYAAAEDSGRVVTLPRQEANKRFLFAVQARDRAGAVTPTFVWNRNVRHVQTSNGKFPVLAVSEQFLGGASFSGRGGLRAFEIVSGQPLEFTWQGDATEYAGIVEAYRYGWNVVDPNDDDDPGWAVEWGSGPNWLRALPRTFTQGSPNFVVQCRDNSGTISRAVYQFQVIQIADRVNQRNLLLVDDLRLGLTGPERVLEAHFDNTWDELLGGIVSGFQPGDIIDAQTSAARMGFALLNDYKACIWFGDSKLASFFHTRLAPLGPTAPQYNWLEVYQARVGNVLLVGQGAGYNTFEHDPPDWLFPIIFNLRAGPGELGFGVEFRPDGSERKRGTLRWAYSGWCLESVDLVRPPLTRVFDERPGPGNLLRTKGCDTIWRGLVAEEFQIAYPDAGSDVRTLNPNRARRERDPDYKLEFEEFYNKNVTTRPVTLVLRDCQVPMYRAEIARDAADGPIADPQNECVPLRRLRSPLDGVVIGVASTVYEETKQLRGSPDFLWGFHPIAFELGALQDALLWILGSQWLLPLNN